MPSKHRVGGSSPSGQANLVGERGGTVDATDLKSVIQLGVWVRIPPLAPNGHNRRRQYGTQEEGRFNGREW